MSSSNSVDIMEKDTASQTGKQEVYELGELGEIESQTSVGSPSLEERISKRKLLPRQVSLIGYVLKPFHINILTIARPLCSTSSPNFDTYLTHQCNWQRTLDQILTNSIVLVVLLVQVYLLV